MELARGGCDGWGGEALIFSLRSEQAAVAVLALDGAASGDSIVGADFPAVQGEDAFSEVLASGCGEAAFPGDVFGFGGAELVVGGWLWGDMCKVFVGGFVAGAVGEDVSGWG